MQRDSVAKRIGFVVRIFFGVAACASIAMADEPVGDKAKAKPTPASASARRVPWTTSRIAGSPEPPPPYTVEPAFPKLTFEFPVVLVPEPGTNRLFLGELRGKISSF